MKNIFFLGLISFFTDLSTEMVYPLIPLYLASMGTSPALLGVIEGVAESLASLLKVFSGYITDKSQKKKTIAFWGYASGLFYKFALIFAGSWTGILFARVIDRIGKGIRTSPRDVLVSESVDKDNMGKAFGLHKALDEFGASLGIIITYFIVLSFSGEYEFKKIFAISMVPAVLGLCMFIFVRQNKTEKPKKHREPFWRDIKKLDNQLKFYLLVVFIFTLGNSSKAFFLFRAKDAGFDDQNVILLYFVCGIVGGLLSMPFGKLSDKIGRKKLLVPGYITFSICYLGFAFANSASLMIAMFVLYGVYTAMIAGAEKAFVAEIAPKHLKGTMLGLHSTIAGIALLPASLIAGALWTGFGTPMPSFLFGSIMAGIATILLIIFMKNKKNTGAENEL